MPKRSSKNVNRIAAEIVNAISKSHGIVGAKKKKKNPAAVALGRLGGKKGGPARALALSHTERSEIARRAALARWSKREETIG